VPVIFFNPSGAPELACEECGCRWFDRMTNRCYECGAEVPDRARAEFERALEKFQAGRGGVAGSGSNSG
jgi:ribosomal protein L37E